MSERAVMLIYAIGVCFTFGFIVKTPDKQEVEVQVKNVYPENTEVSVELTRYQVEKMLEAFEADAHPADSKKFTTIIKRDFEEWSLSPTHLTRSSK